MITNVMVKISPSNCLPLASIHSIFRRSDMGHLHIMLAQMIGIAGCRPEVMNAIQAKPA